MDKIEKPINSPQDEKIFQDATAIFNQTDLTDLINYIYNEYQYKGTQYDKLTRLINYLPANSSKFTKPELVIQSKKLSDYLVSLDEFLQKNFKIGKPGEDGDATFYLNIQETGFETESFLIEFQVLALDIERAYKNYLAAFMNK